jgi:hypothetical protein
MQIVPDGARASAAGADIPARSDSINGSGRSCPIHPGAGSRRPIVLSPLQVPCAASGWIITLKHAAGIAPLQLRETMMAIALSVKRHRALASPAQLAAETNVRIQRWLINALRGSGSRGSR